MATKLRAWVPYVFGSIWILLVWFYVYMFSDQLFSKGVPALAMWVGLMWVGLWFATGSLDGSSERISEKAIRREHRMALRAAALVTVAISVLFFVLQVPAGRIRLLLAGGQLVGSLVVYALTFGVPLYFVARVRYRKAELRRDQEGR